MYPSSPPSIFAPDHAVDALGPVVLVFVKRPPTEAVFDAIRARLDAARQAYPAGIGFFQIIDNDRNPSTEASRKRYLELVDRYRAAMKGAAFVLIREGFGGAAIRSVISGAVLVARPPFPVKALATIEEGSIWLSNTMTRAGAQAPASVRLTVAGKELVSRVAAGSASRG